jgi:hypothetical protein
MIDGMTFDSTKQVPQTTSQVRKGGLPPLNFREYCSGARIARQ